MQFILPKPFSLFYFLILTFMGHCQGWSTRRRFQNQYRAWKKLL